MGKKGKGGKGKKGGKGETGKGEKGKGIFLFPASREMEAAWLQLIPLSITGSNYLIISDKNIPLSRGLMSLGNAAGPCVCMEL